MDYTTFFTTTTGLIIIINAITQFCKSQFKISNNWIQYFSWGIGILLAVVGQLTGIGMFIDTNWLQAILLGLGSALSSNGTFDTGVVDWIVSLFKTKILKIKKES
jgi:mannose/fructose/N-acetylgalactosamine-specific phosphotransferase system component IID